ncbi:alpha/beta hydrolase [Pontixanthobacter aquaemixtae]|uniref:Alpha/beta hydrolase n=1 Tax=Pontixanthobacter aquaemixtae TaxID=1958940 RepID=A0A844ZTC8_9SPHN|nr:alpha/beta hydrolase [Pontixanthobacter aquaemixtae]MXO90988.1 alpha/beta hydrolase [Pontixanthobacter aquaemixtae]
MTSLLRTIPTVILAVSALLLVGQPSARDVDQQPRSSASTPEKPAWSAEPMADGRSKFEFTGWAGPDLPVWAYVPAGIDRKTAPVLIVMHGAKRDPRRYLEEWVPFADQDGFIVIAPEFSRNDFPGSRSYNLGNMWARGGKQINPQGEWSFAAIEPLFDFAVAKLEGKQQQYTLYGHSAGSQFVHRFLFITPEARVTRYLPANAGWYTAPDPDIAFPYGLKGLGVSEAMMKEALAQDVVILLGDADTDRHHESLRRTKPAMAQGPHRFARGKSFYEAGKKLAEELGTEFNWSLRVIPGVAHENGGIAAGAHDLVK